MYVFDTTVFKSTDGGIVVFLGNGPWTDGKILFAPEEGERFYELAVGGFIMAAVSQPGGSFEAVIAPDPHDGTWQSILVDSPHHGVTNCELRNVPGLGITVNGRPYLRQQRDYDGRQLVVERLPKHYLPVGLFSLEGSEEPALLVVRRRYRWNGHHYWVYDLTERPAFREPAVSRLPVIGDHQPLDLHPRAAGRIRIQPAAGDGNRQQSPKPSTWRGQPLTALPVARYRLGYRPDGSVLVVCPSAA